MADYIDRENVKNLIEVATEDSWELDYTLDRLKEVNSTDVIERSKIDKAIEEINNAEVEVDFMNEHASAFNSGLFKALEILKSNIGG